MYASTWGKIQVTNVIKRTKTEFYINLRFNMHLPFGKGSVSMKGVADLRFGGVKERGLGQRGQIVELIGGHKPYAS